MNLEKLFKYFRKEEVVLWIGSGFSKYAGYPTGKELSKLIYDQLIPQQDKGLEELKYMSLPDLAERIVREDELNRKRLNSLLKEVFTKKPSSLKYHIDLTKIPHIKTIITTNYDALLEKAYGKNAQKVVNIEDVVTVSNKKTLIYKIHGDISDLDSLIITKSDYADFFAENKSHSLLWSSIISSLLNKVIVFIGYNLEDDNVRNIIKGINKELGIKRKDIYLIAPKLDSNKSKDLQHLQIQYVDLKGEEFLLRLSKNIQENIYNDFQNALVGPEILREYFNSHKMKVNLESLENRYNIKSVEGIGEKLKGKINFQIKTDTEEHKYLQEFVEGKKFGQVKLSHSAIKGFDIKINGISFNEPESEKYELILSSVPSKNGIADIVFSDNYEFNDIRFELFVSKEKLELRSYLYTCEYIISKTLIKNEINFHIDSSKFNKVTEAIKIFEFLKRICEGQEFKVFIHGAEKFHAFCFDSIKEMEEEFDALVKHYNKLREVENIYKVRFTDFEPPSFTDFNNVDIALRFANEKSEIMEWADNLEFDVLSEEDLQRLSLVNDGVSPVVIQNQKPFYLDIHNRKICIGFERKEITDPVILNYVELSTNKTKNVKIVSRNKKWIVSFVEQINI